MMICPSAAIIGGSTARQAHDAQDIGVQRFRQSLVLIWSAAQWASHRCRGNQHVDAAKHHTHALHRRADFFKIAHIGAQPQRCATGVFDFQLG
jgi:hypothetical protein